MAEGVVIFGGSDLRVTRFTGSPFAVLRVRGPTPAAAEALGAAFGSPWPTTPGEVGGDGGVGIFPLRPGEWAVTGLEVAEVARLARAALGDALHHLADETAGRVVFHVAGARAREVLAQGCPLDLHPRVFAPSRCALTVFARVGALVHSPGEDDAFLVIVDMGVGEHVAAWFKAAAAPAGVPS